MPYEFDHIVIIARDKIMPVANKLKSLGFFLTPMAKHNLGSCNQLAMLSDSYVEVLGWEEGTIPQRKEIADLPLGLDALVFRTYNAAETFSNLTNLGFLANPVQELSRPALVNGKEELAQFNTVRFSSQPIPGLRMYFCEHVTPQFLWFDEVLKHPNLCNHLREIALETNLLEETSAIFITLLNLSENDTDTTEDLHTLTLPNCKIRIKRNSNLALTKIVHVAIHHELKNGSPDPSIKEITLTHQVCESI